MARKPKSIVVFGRLFRDRNGNTYHSVSVIVDGVAVKCPGIHYGYGNQYLYTAFDCLAEQGLLPGYKGGAGASKYCAERGIALHYESLYVCKKADL